MRGKLTSIVKPINESYTEDDILGCVRALHLVQKDLGKILDGKEGDFQYAFLHGITLMLSVAREALNEMGISPDKVINDMMMANSNLMRQFMDAKKSGYI